MKENDLKMLYNNKNMFPDDIDHDLLRSMAQKRRK